MKFLEYNINKELNECLNKNGFKELSPIQELTLPYILKNESSFVKAPTGSGKTLCYLIPILNDLDINLPTQAVIIVPTALLVDQLYHTFRKFVSYKPFKVDAIKDGTSKNATSFNGQIIISTPEQFIFNYEKFNLKYLKRLVIDEGDMLIFDGFEEQLKTILSYDLKGSKFFFTASVDEHLDSFVKKYISANKLLQVDKGKITSSNVKHYFIDIKNLNKFDAFVKFLNIKKPYKCLAFVSKKDDLVNLEKVLHENNISFLEISSNTSRREQNRILKDFASSNNHLLIGTDLIARGFDVEDISDVVSLDLPYDLTYYYHRAGRTGRFNNKGNSYVFYSDDNLTKARELNSKKGLKFSYLSFKGDELKEERDINSKVKKQKINNKYLEQEIKKNIYKLKLRTKKVKPNYKKKIKLAIERTKAKHKEDVIKKNIEKRNLNEGTSYAYFEDNKHKKNRK